MSGFTFTPAAKERLKLRMAITGAAGSGKSYTALAIGSRIAERENGQVAVIDTEHRSALLYSDRFQFQHLEFGPPYSPQRYLDAIKAAETAGFPVLIIDSLSHAWFAEGGVLDIVDNATARSTNNNKFTSGWSKGTPEHNRLIEGILGSKLHIIATIRSKQDYAVDAANKVTKLGMAPVQREGVDYEFAIVGDLNADHRMSITKSRMAELADNTYQRPGAEFADKVFDWLNDGGEPAPAQTPAFEPPAAVSKPSTPAPATEPVGGEQATDADARAEAAFWKSMGALGLDELEVGRKLGDVPSKFRVANNLSWGQLIAEVVKRTKQTATPAAPNGPQPELPWQTRQATEPQIKAIYAIARGTRSLDDADIEASCQERYGRPPAELSRQQASEFIDSLKLGAAL